MPYTLTLTKDERKAIDWVGHRYSNGNDLYKLLTDGEMTPDDRDWSDDGDITFKVPEAVAWEIKENAEAEDGFWPCFSGELASKMQRFIDGIV